MSDLKPGDLVRLPTDPSAYQWAIIDQSYGLLGEDVVGELAGDAEPRLLTNEEKAGALGGKVGTLEGIDDDAAMVNVRVRDSEEPEGVLVPIAVAVPLATLTPATA